MFGRSTILFPIIVLTVLAAMSVWIESKVKAPLHRSKASFRHDPDYYLENFVTTKTGENGQLKTMLAAVAMLHYPDDDSTYLTRPRFTQYSENKPYTQIEGQKGEISKDGEQVDFTSNVVVYRPAFGDRPDMRLTTDYLRIFCLLENQLRLLDFHIHLENQHLLEYHLQGKYAYQFGLLMLSC